MVKNNQGQTSKVINQTKAEKGKDIYLTIDLDLQQTAEKYLEKTIYAMKYGGGVSGETGYTSSSEMAPKAKSGAVVAIDVATGDVLAMGFPFTCTTLQSCHNGDCSARFHIQADNCYDGP